MENRDEWVEVLEARRLLTGEPWGPFPVLLGQDKAVANYPWLNGAGESVAVIDRGVDYNHPVLGKGFGPGKKVIAGYDFLMNDADPNIGPGVNGEYIEPHGTGVTGIIAADPYVYKNYKFQGIAPKVNIIALRQNSSAQVKQCLQWVINNRTKYNIVAVNLTDFIGSGHYPTIYQAEVKTLLSAGVFIATPTGNGGVSTPIEYPAADPNIYGTAAVDRYDNIWVKDQRGADLDVLGPGLGVTIPYDNASYQPIYTDAAEGTSWSTPHVTATAALIKQINPAFTPAQIIDIIKQSGKPIYDPLSGRTYPRLNINEALQLAYQISGITPAPPPPAGVEAPYGGTRPTISSSDPTNLEAENFDEGGEGFGYHDVDLGNIGGKYRVAGVDIESTLDSSGLYNVGWTRAGEWLKYMVKVAAAGTYDIGFRVACLGNGGQFHLEVDGLKVGQSLTVANTNGWQTYLTEKLSSVSLASGDHTLKLVMDSNGVNGFTGNFNYLSFAPVAISPPVSPPPPTSPPPPPISTPFGGTAPVIGAGTTMLEVENFDDGGEGLACHDTEATNLGGATYRTGGVDLETSTDSGGYALDFTRAGEWLNYTVNVSADSLYNLAARVASSGGGGRFHIELDPGPSSVKTAATMVPNTGAWKTWQTINAGSLQLIAGTHVLRLFMDSGGTASANFVGNFNWLSLTKTI